MHTSMACGVTFLALSAALGCSKEVGPVADHRGPPGQAAGSSTEIASGSSRSFATASVLTWPGARCAMHPSTTNDPAKSLTVVADDVGVTLFGAIKAAPGDPDNQLTLDCKDASGRIGSYTADLTADSTFQRVPAGTPAPAMTRPGLTGDPMQFTQEYLLNNHFGVRPDPVKSPRSYEMWLRTAQKSGRLFTTPTSQVQEPGEAAYDSTTWGGGVIQGNTEYVIAVWEMNVPTITGAQPDAETGLWGGLGGFGGPHDLIQDGVNIEIRSNMASYATFLEYEQGNMCGPFSCLGYTVPLLIFNVSGGDKVGGEAWACDSQGNPNVSGGYGCFLLEDMTTGQIADCNQPGNPNGPFNPCASIPAVSAYLGRTAETIIERNTWHNILVDYGSANITLDGIDINGAEHNYSNTDYIQMNLINGSGQIMEEAEGDLPSPDGTSFVWERGS